MVGVALVPAVVLTVNVPVVTVEPAGPVVANATGLPPAMDTPAALSVTVMAYPAGKKVTGPVMVIVPVEAAPPVTPAGKTTTDEILAVYVLLAVCLTAIRAVLLVPNPAGGVAVIFTFAAVAPAVVVIPDNVADVAPAGTVTEVKPASPIPTRALLSVKPMATPPAGAGPVSLTVTEKVPTPPTMCPTLGATDDSTGGGAAAGGLTVRVADAEPLNVAVIVTLVVAATAVVLIWKFALFDPAGTTTVFPPGKLVAVLLSEIATEAPPAGAFPLRVTVPVELLPPWTLDGFSVTEVTDSWTGGLAVDHSSAPRSGSNSGLE